MLQSSPCHTVMFRFLILLSLLALQFPGSSFAVEYSTILFHHGIRATVCRVKVREEHLDLFHRDENGVPFKRFDRLQKWLGERDKKLVFAMNAGMYHGDFSAVGLYISQGQQHVPLNTDNGWGNFFLKPNGVFALTEAGACVVETSEFPRLREHVTLATQSGPLLVRAGHIHPAFNPQSKSLLFRNGVGIPSPDVAVFVIAETPLSLYQFAALFRDELHCPDALYLDGTISALYAPSLRRDDFKMELGPIVGVTE